MGATCPFCGPRTRRPEHDESALLSQWDTTLRKEQQVELKPTAVWSAAPPRKDSEKEFLHTRNVHPHFDDLDAKIKETRDDLYHNHKSVLCSHIFAPMAEHGSHLIYAPDEVLEAMWTLVSVMR